MVTVMVMRPSNYDGTPVVVDKLEISTWSPEEFDQAERMLAIKARELTKAKRVGHWVDLAIAV